MKTYICWYAQQSVRVSARTPFEAQCKGAAALGVSPTRAHYVKPRLVTFNAQGDRYAA